MISSLLYDFNHAPIWRREFKVWDRTVRAASVDRLVVLALHRMGQMGTKAPAGLINRLGTKRYTSLLASRTPLVT